MALFEPGHENVPWYGTQTSTALTAQIRNARKRFEADSTYAPLYAALQNQIYQDSLLGTAGGDITVDVPGYLMPIKRKKKDDGDFFSGGFSDAIGSFANDTGTFGFYSAGTGDKSFLNAGFGGGGGGGAPAGYQVVGARKATLHRPATRGFLDLYTKDIAPAMSRAAAESASFGRRSDISDIEALGPLYREAMRRASPEQAALLDSLYGRANSDLALGAELNPSQTRNVQQAIRAGQSARGLGVGSGDNLREALASLDYGRGLDLERRGNAYAALQAMSSFYGDIPSRLLARDSGSTTAAANMFNSTGSSRNAATSLFNPESQMNSNIYAFNAEAANKDKMMGQEQWGHMMDQIKDSVMYWK